MTRGEVIVLVCVTLVFIASLARYLYYGITFQLMPDIGQELLEESEEKGGEDYDEE
jgi:hypothetical protein